MIKINDYIIKSSLEEILSKLQRELTNGKLSSFRRTASGMRVPCPHHSNGQENHESCYINDEGIWHCFTCGEKGHLGHFVAECFDKSDLFGDKWLTDNFGESKEESKIKFCDFDLIDTKENKTDYLSEDVLTNFQSWHPYMAKRKLNQKVCETFKVKYDPKTECIVFPVWDEYNKLYMLTRRSVNNKNFIIDSSKEKPVYLYNYVNTHNIQEVTIVESQINCLTLWSMGIPSVALFGTGTQHQYDILNKSSINHYYLAFDGDNAGRGGIRRFLKNIRQDVFVDVIILPEGRDVNDLTEEEFNNLKIVDKTDWLKNYS